MINVALYEFYHNKKKKEVEILQRSLLHFLVLSCILSRLGKTIGVTYNMVAKETSSSLEEDLQQLQKYIMNVSLNPFSFSFKPGHGKQRKTFLPKALASTDVHTFSHTCTVPHEHSHVSG